MTQTMPCFPYTVLLCWTIHYFSVSSLELFFFLHPVALHSLISISTLLPTLISIKANSYIKCPHGHNIHCGGKIFNYLGQVSQKSSSLHVLKLLQKKNSKKQYKIQQTAEIEVQKQTDKINRVISGVMTEN